MRREAGCRRLPRRHVMLVLLPCLWAIIGPRESCAQPAGLAPEKAPVSSLAGPAFFPHERHFTELGIECKRCHHEVRAAALKMPHSEYFDDFWIDCRICHKSTTTPPNMPQACVACHRGSPKNAADETLGAKVVIHKTCWACHDAGKGADASKGCATCHRRLPKGSGTPAPPPATASRPKE